VSSAYQIEHESGRVSLTKTKTKIKSVRKHDMKGEESIKVKLRYDETICDNDTLVR